MNCPVLEIDDSELEPSAGVTPSGVDIRVVLAVQLFSTHVLRWKISCAPFGFGAVAPRFDAVDVNETNKPFSDTEGFELGPLPGVVPSGVDTRKVVGVHVSDATPPHVSRRNTCGVTPSNVTFETRFVASETNATHSPSELIAGLKLSPFPAERPSADSEIICATNVVGVTTQFAVRQVGRQ